MSRPVVIKVGGSLLSWPELPARLVEFLTALRRSGSGQADHLVLVPGGGAMVNAIRDLDHVHGLDDHTSHWLAIQALDLTARLLGAILPDAVVAATVEELRAAWEAGRLPILAPMRMLMDDEKSANDPLPASWSVTSDSIAAHLARRLNAHRLILLKSAKIDSSVSSGQAVEAGWVDPYFPTAARGLPRVELIGLRDDTLKLHEIHLI